MIQLIGSTVINNPCLRRHMNFNFWRILSCRRKNPHIRNNKSVHTNIPGIFQKLPELSGIQQSVSQIFVRSMEAFSLLFTRVGCTALVRKTM